MSIKTTKKELRQIVREEYARALKEEEMEMSRDGVETMKDVAYEIAKKLARAIQTQAMSNRIDDKRLLSAVIDQVKLQMKD